MRRESSLGDARSNQRMWTYLLFGGLGALAGWAYSSTIGCSTGACLITRYPPVSAAYGALMGVMFARARLGG